MIQLFLLDAMNKKLLIAWRRGQGNGKGSLTTF